MPFLPHPQASETAPLNHLLDAMGGVGNVDASWGNADPCHATLGWKGVKCSSAGDVQGVSLAGEFKGAGWPRRQLFTFMEVCL